MAISKSIPFKDLFAVPLRNGLTRPKAIRGIGVRMVNMGEIFAHDRIRAIQMDRVLLDDREQENYLLEPGDLLFARQSLVLSGAGKCSILLERDEPVTFESHIIRARLDKNVADPLFYFYLFRSKAGRNLIESIVEQVAAAGIRGSDLANISVPKPSLPEQRTIAGVLGALDDKIELNRRTSRTLEKLARAIFRAWFVDFEPVKAKAAGARSFPGMPQEAFDALPTRLVPSELGPIPEEWEIRTIGEMVEGIYDGPHATPPESDTGPIFLGIKNLAGSYLDLSELRYISEENWIKWTRRVVPKSGDIVFSYEATLGFFALIPSGIRCCLGRRLALVRPRSTNGFGNFWFHQFIGDSFQQYLISHSIHGSTVDRTPLKDFPNYLVLNPPGIIKSEFESKAISLWSKIHASQAESRKLAALREYLLPKLLSGAVHADAAKRLFC
ncbi:MAG: restriction endonuclease subunit S [Candidatus Sumerlaeota bacterium]|nr:restriction endonuclease subunit S [Candidatus Sumerlaeota bacterium]